MKKMPWTADERAAINRNFMRNILMGTVPRKEDCNNCKEREPCLGGRDWKTIKYFVHTAIQRNKRILACKQ